MRRVIRKSLAFILCIVIVFGSVPLAGLVGLELPLLGDVFDIKTEAATSGYYTYTVSNGKATITDCDASININVTIPSTLGGYPVTTIGNKAFYGCSSITKITIPDTVTSIGDSAFSGCSNVTSIIIPDSVKSIGDSVFYNCVYLTSITIPDGVTSIGESEFAYCQKLKSITIPNSVTKINDEAFKNCTSLENISIPNSVTSIGDSVFSNCTKLTSVVIPEGVKSVGNEAFEYCLNLENITIPDSVKSIGAYAFYKCKSLTSISIPAGVTSIGPSAFAYCSSIADVYYRGNVESWCNISFDSSSANPNYNSSNLYIDGVLATDIIIPDTVTRIKDYAFNNCSSITSITISDSVTYIGDSAFYGCKNLASISLPDNFVDIGSGGLTDTAIYNDALNWDNNVLYYGNYLIESKKSISGSYTVKNGTKFISSFAFEECENLTSVTIPDSVIHIGDYAFYNCSGLTSAYYPATPEDISFGLQNYDLIDNLIFEYDSERPYYEEKSGSNLKWRLYADGELIINGSGEMYDYDDGYYVRAPWIIRSYDKNIVIKSVSLSDEITSIGDYAFYTCSGLTSITIPESVTNVGEGAFSGCSGLTNVFYSGDLAGWCKLDFYNTLYTSSNPLNYADNLYINGVLLEGNIEIPETVTVINNYVFSSYGRITSITFPRSITSVGFRAFYDCSNIETTYYCGTYDEWKNVTVGNDNDYLINNIVYEYGTDNANYGNGSCGDGLTWKIDLDGNLIVEGSGAVPNYSESSTPWYNLRDKIKTVIIPEGVTNIGASAFSGCTNIEKFTVDENNTAFTSDEYGVLYNSEKTKLIKYPANSTNTEYTVPESVESIRPKAFEQAKYLTSVTLNTGITEICDSAFIGCSNLVAANYYGTQENWNAITVNANNESLTNSLIYEFGTENSNYGSGTCGSNLTWIFYSNGSLVISGTGAMANYATSTPAPWSRFRPNITSIILPDGLTAIGNSAFAFCLNVETIEIPSSVTSVGQLAFAECDKLKTVSVPYGVKTIGADTFRDCNALESVVLPDSVTSIGNSAFYMCCSLKNVTLPKNITAIGDYTLYKCTSLENIIIPDQVRYIGNYAFYYCESIETLKIPDAVTSIKDYAFYYCSGLKELTMPVDVSVYNSANVFAGCKEIDKITLTKGASGVMSDYGTSTSASSSTLNYKYTPWYISECSEIVIGEGVKNISDYAFYYCSSLKNLTIPQSVKSIGYMSLYYCSGIKNIYFTGILADWCKITIDNVHPVNYTDNLYINGKLVEGDLIIPDGVTYIGDMAFGELDGITNVVIPDSVKSIGKNAFGGCDGIVSVKIGNGVTDIKEYAFVECPAMTTLVIGNNVATIGNGAFMGCVELRELTMPVTAKIYNSADTFYGCDKLEKVTLTKGTTGIMQNYGTSSAEDAPLTHCCNTPWYMSDSCTEVIIEEGVKNIGENAFRSCDHIKNVKIPSSVTSIGYNAFRMCYGLEKVTIPDAVTTIGDGAFYYCDGITELTMPVSAKIYNSSNTFYNCTDIDIIIFTKGTGTMPDYGTSTSASSLTTYYQYTPWYISGCPEIFLPNGVSTIGMYAFHECGNLTTVNFEGSSDEYYEILIKDYNNPLIFAKINFVSYTVKWIFGNETKQETIRVGEKIVPPAFESAEGYLFVGWSPEVPKVMPANNLTFTAVLETKKFNVKWSVDDAITEEIYEYGQQIIKPADPEKIGYTFDGWTPEIPDVMPSYDLSFTAIWSVNSYDAVFDANGGVWADDSQRKVEAFDFDSEITVPETPSKPGYIFSGWSCEDKNLGTDLGVMDDVNGKVFKAVWIASTDTVYTVETYTMNTAGEYEKSVQTLNGATDSTVNAEYQIEDGFTFNEEKSVTSGVISADNSLVLKVYFDRNKYSLTTIVDGVRESTEYFYGSIIPEIIPEKAGYTFVGWDNEIPATMPAKDLILTAEFDADSINAVFNANGGEWSDGSASKSVATDFDSKITAPENPTRQGYDFAGWDSEIGIMDDVNGKTFNALWTARNDTKYTVETYTMDVNGKYAVASEEKQGTTENGVSVTANAEEGFTFNSAKSILNGTIAADGSLVLKIYYDRNKYTLTTISDGVSTDTKYYYEAKIETPAAPVKIGHTFVEWSGELPETMPAENIYVEAVWQINTYTVNWVIDGKTTKTEVVYGESIVAPEAPAKTGYKFVGWTPTIPAKMPANDVTFTAKYGPAIVMSIRNPSTTTISYGDSIILHADIIEALPSGWKIKWTADNGNFSYSANGETCTITPSKSGDTTFTATVYDENGNEISKDTQTMKSKAGFFDKIIAFFKKIFGATKTIPQIYKGIF